MAYPCGVCGKNCLKNVVACEKCDRWFHARCEKLTKAHIKCLSSTDCDFLCTKCTEDSNSDFDFGLSLKRLEKYSAAGSLENGVKTEKILLRNRNSKPLNERTDLSFSAHEFIEDTISTGLLAKSGCSISDRYPVQVRGDGNCLFSSLSLALVGNEGLANQIRVLTCLELVENSQFYNTDQNAKFLLVSPNYDESCRNAAKLGEWSSAWTIMAAATVIGCPIHSVYPTMNGILDSCVGILNHVFYPAGSKSSKSEPIKILWTSTTLANRNTWVPNHFVPLILKSSEVSIIDLDSFSEFPPLNSTKLNDTNSCPTIFDTTCNSVIGNP